jgi:hypothetical protein
MEQRMSDNDASAQSDIIKRYYQLRTYLGINLLDLDRAYMETPRIIQDAVELAAEAAANENSADHILDVLMSEASSRIRAVPVAGKEPSEARIKSLLPLEQDVMDARTALEKARYEAQLCTGLFRSFESQARLLGKASDMVIAGYITPSAAINKQRDEIRQARVAQDNLAKSQGMEGPKIGRPVE